MAWSDALDEQSEPERQTGLDWIHTISEADQAKSDRRMAKARRKLDRAERKYLRKMRGHDND
jgi:hypothetical protein